jgi:hypothetical protein
MLRSGDVMLWNVGESRDILDFESCKNVAGGLSQFLEDNVEKHSSKIEGRKRRRSSSWGSLRPRQIACT